MSLEHGYSSYAFAQNLLVLLNLFDPYGSNFISLIIGNLKTGKVKFFTSNYTHSLIFNNLPVAKIFISPK